MQINDAIKHSAITVKGEDLQEGDWIIFMNQGELFRFRDIKKQAITGRMIVRVWGSNVYSVYEPTKEFTILRNPNFTTLK